MVLRCVDRVAQLELHYQHGLFPRLRKYQEHRFVRGTVFIDRLLDKEVNQFFFLARQVQDDIIKDLKQTIKIAQAFTKFTKRLLIEHAFPIGRNLHKHLDQWLLIRELRNSLKRSRGIWIITPRPVRLHYHLKPNTILGREVLFGERSDIEVCLNAPGYFTDVLRVLRDCAILTLRQFGENELYSGLPRALRTGRNNNFSVYWLDERHVEYTQNFKSRLTPGMMKLALVPDTKGKT